MKRYLLIEVEEDNEAYDVIMDLYFCDDVNIVCNWEEEDVFQHECTEIAMLGGYQCKCGNYWGLNGCPLRIKDSND